MKSFYIINHISSRNMCKLLKKLTILQQYYALWLNPGPANMAASMENDGCSDDVDILADFADVCPDPPEMRSKCKTCKYVLSFYS